jgi:hypothetical protein
MEYLDSKTAGSVRCGAETSVRPAPRESLVLELPCGLSLLPPVQAVRGTVILCSLLALRELGVFDQYRLHLSKEQVADILGILARAWVPLELASAHYLACDALGLSPTEQMEVGLLAGKRALGTMLGTAMQLSRQDGATPWSLIEGGNRVWKRAFHGGGLRVTRIGEMEALAEVHKNSLVTSIEYCRNSFRGFWMALHGHVMERMSVRVVYVGLSEVHYRIMWRG